MRPRISKRAGIAALALLAALSVVGLTQADQTRAGRVTVLGAAAPAKPGCPADCAVEAQVTGFQLSIGRDRNPFRVPDHGRIVAWSIKLGKPDKDQLRFFNQRFGGAQARISILKPTGGKKAVRRSKPRYRLLRQSPIADLQPFFGSTITFGLDPALKVRKGNVVALTLPTWAPAFSVGPSARWRASRAPTSQNGRCSLKGGAANVRAGTPHDQKGAERKYGCAYRGARLLYSARFVAAASKR